MIADKYVKGDAVEDERRDSSRVRTVAARSAVRQIKHHRILSSDWLQLVDSLEQLSRIAQLESMIPECPKDFDCGKGSRATSQQRGRIAGKATLWDQDANEDATRILVEEAKVNLCLRIIHDYKCWQYNVDLRQESIEQALAEYKQDFHIEKKMLIFEESLGLLLLRSFAHVETLQLTDIPLLIDHMVMVLDFAYENAACSAFSINDCEEFALCESEGKCGYAGEMMDLKTQENLVSYYFTSLMRFSEELNSTEILLKVRETRLIQLIVRHADQFMNKYPQETMGVVCQGLSALADNEDFSMKWSDYIGSRSDRELFLRVVRDQMVDTFFYGDEGHANPDSSSGCEFHIFSYGHLSIDERKAKIRPLLDLINKIMRSLSR